MITEKEYKQFRDLGYFIRESFFDPNLCESLVARLDELYSTNPGSKRLLPDKVFGPLIVDESILAIAHNLLGPDVRFHHANGRVQRTHCTEKPWHHDYDGHLREGTTRSMIHLMIYPLGLTDSTGPLLILPGSHRNGVARSYPNRFGTALIDGARKLVCEAGAIVILHSALWHARIKPLALPRYDLNLSYCTPDPTRRERREWSEVHSAVAASADPSHLYLFRQDVD